MFLDADYIMEVDKSLGFTSAAALLVLGVALGGFTSYQMFDERFTSLEQEVNDPREVVHINSSDSNQQLTELFKEVDEAVVSITTLGTSNAQGSGFVYSEDGYIVTNQHVVEGAENVRVTFTDGSSQRAEVVGTDENNDLAVLSVNKNDLNAVELGNLSDVRVGQTAVAVGNPFGLRGTMTSGIISQQGRMLPTDTGFSIPNVLQTDAAINPGNSGGPLLNVQGELIGVNTAINSRTGTFSGIGFAIPVNIVKNVVPDMIEEGGSFDYPWIGVSGYTVTPEIAEAMNMSNASGFLVVNVAENGPAEEAGIRAGNETVEVGQAERVIGGDVIVGIDGEEMQGIGDILTYLQSGTEVGQEVNITLIREGEEITLPLTLGSREDSNN